MSLITRILTLFFLFTATAGFAQTSLAELKPDPVREKMFLPYLAVRHGGPQATESWKEANILRYYQELWYFSESFYIQRDYLQQGASLDESIIDITRFESSRKQSEPAVVLLPGFKDALILLPADKLIHKPVYPY